MKTTDLRTAQIEYDMRIPPDDEPARCEKPEGKRLGIRKIRSARKPHQCDGCGRTILRSESYAICTYKWVDTVVSFCYCAQCQTEGEDGRKL